MKRVMKLFTGMVFILASGSVALAEDIGESYGGAAFPQEQQLPTPSYHEDYGSEYDPNDYQNDYSDNYPNDDYLNEQYLNGSGDD
jgi:hypothetical protein